MREDCFVIHKARAISRAFEAELLEWVESMDDYRGGVANPGRSTAGVREQKWYQESGCYFDPSWKKHFARWESHPYHDRLRAFQARMQETVDPLCRERGLPAHPRFNSLLLNKYRNGHDFIRPHSDSQRAFGDEPLIAVISLGDTRTFRYTSKTNPDDTGDVELRAGSLLLMAGKM